MKKEFKNLQVLKATDLIWHWFFNVGLLYILFSIHQDQKEFQKISYTCSVQTLWDRINSNLGSSGKRKSLKSELPCISEEIENVDEIGGAFEKGIRSLGMTGSITREPLTEIIDYANPSTSVVHDDILTGGRADLHEQDANRRFTSKGRENQSLSFGANGAKR